MKITLSPTAGFVLIEAAWLFPRRRAAAPLKRADRGQDPGPGPAFRGLTAAAPLKQCVLGLQVPEGVDFREFDAALIEIPVKAAGAGPDEFTIVIGGGG